MELGFGHVKDRREGRDLPRELGGSSHGLCRAAPLLGEALRRLALVRELEPPLVAGLDGDGRGGLRGAPGCLQSLEGLRAGQSRSVEGRSSLVAGDPALGASFVEAAERTPGGFRFRTLHDAERALQRVVNLILERERSLLEREAATETLRAAKEEGRDPKEWSPMPPLRGLSNEAAGRIINAINAFIISRRFQDELAEKRRADDLENRLNEALELVERYGKRLEEIAASQRGERVAAGRLCTTAFDNARPIRCACPQQNRDGDSQHHTGEDRDATRPLARQRQACGLSRRRLFVRRWRLE